MSDENRGTLWAEIKWNDDRDDEYAWDKIQDWIEKRIRQIVQEELKELKK